MSVQPANLFIEIGKLTIAARSIWPAGAAAGLTVPGVALLAPTGGRTALGTGGLPPTFGAVDAPGLGPVIGGLG